MSSLSLAKVISTYYDKPCRIRFDHYIDWFELDLLRVNITAALDISVTRAHFARYGVPNKFLSDDGSHYVSQEFSSFAVAYDFQLITRSPFYARATDKANQKQKKLKRCYRSPTHLMFFWSIGIHCLRV